MSYELLFRRRKGGARRRHRIRAQRGGIHPRRSTRSFRLFSLSQCVTWSHLAFHAFLSRDYQYPLFSPPFLLYRRPPLNIRYPLYIYISLLLSFLPSRGYTILILFLPFVLSPLHFCVIAILVCSLSLAPCLYMSCLSPLLVPTLARHSARKRVFRCSRRLLTRAYLCRV